MRMSIVRGHSSVFFFLEGVKTLITDFHFMKLSARNSFSESRTYRRRAVREMLSHLLPSGLFLFLIFLRS